MSLCCRLYIVLQQALLTPMEGTRQNPIDILDNQEEDRQINERIQYERNKQSLYRAHMGSDFDVLVEVIKVEMKGAPEQKNRILMNRLNKFFSPGVKTINISVDYFRQRRQPDYRNQNASPVANQIILYGVDFLGTRQIKNKFTGYQINVVWLDDSHCKIIFESAVNAKLGLEMNLLKKEQGIVKLQNQQMELPRGWFQLLPYNYLTYERKLFGRYAVNNEDKMAIQRSNQYYMYQEARKKFQASIREEVTQIRYIQTMRKYGLIDGWKARQRINRRRQNDGDRKNRRQNSNERGNNYYGRNGRNNYNNRQNRTNRNYNSYQNDQTNENNNSMYNRSRNKYTNNNQNDYNEFDNLSIASRGSRLSKPSQKQPRRERKFSGSVCSKDNQKDENKSNYSFILNQSQISSSQQIAKQFGNLSFQNIDQLSNINHKQEEKDKQLDFSYELNDLQSPKKSDRKLDNSIYFDASQTGGMNKKKSNVNISYVFEQSTYKQKEKENAKGQISIVVLADEDGY